MVSDAYPGTKIRHAPRVGEGPHLDLVSIGPQRYLRWPDAFENIYAGKYIAMMNSKGTIVFRLGTNLGEALETLTEMVRFIEERVEADENGTYAILL